MFSDPHKTRNETDSSGRNEIPPNSLSFKNSTTQALKQLTLQNNRASNPSLQKEFHVWAERRIAEC